MLHRIQGAYALGIICADEPDQLIAVRKDSPLILGYGKGCNFLASDVTAIIKYTREVGYLDDGEVAVLTKDGIQCYNHLHAAGGEGDLPRGLGGGRGGKGRL